MSHFFIADIAVNVIEVWAATWLLKRKLGIITGGKHRLIFGAILVFLAECLLNFFEAPPASTAALMSAAYLMYASAFFQGSIMMRIMWGCVVALCTLVADVTVTSIMLALFSPGEVKNALSPSKLRILGVSMYASLMVLSTWILGQGSKAQNISLPRKSQALFVAFVLVATFVVQETSLLPVFSTFAPSQELAFGFATWCLTALVLACCALVNELSAAYHKQARTRRELQETLTQYEKWRSLETEIRQWEHDKKYQITVLEKYLEDGDMSGLRKQLTEMRNAHDESLHAAVNVTGNKIVDALLHSRSEICQNKGITLEIEAAAVPNLPLSDLDTGILFGNLLDNAIEACERIGADRQRLIEVHIGQTGETFRLHIRNTSSGEYTRKGQALVTTKEGDGHGLGLKSARQIAKRARGILEIEPDIDVFSVYVLIPLKKNH